MKHPLRLALAVGAAVGLLTACEPVAAENLLDVLAQARAADPLLAGAQARRGVQEEAAQQARAALLPQWQLGASGQRLQPEGERSHAVSSHLSQVLLDLGRLRSWEAERTLAGAQQARVRAAEQDLHGRVARAYFGVLSAQAALAATRANEEALGQQVAQAEARFKAGLSAQVDVDQARAYHALSRSGTVQAGQAVADAREALAEITGRAPGPLQPLRPDLPAGPPVPADPQAWVGQAQQTHPLLQAEGLGLQATELRVAAARAGHWPTLSLGLDTERRGGPAMTETTRRSETTLSLRVVLPLFAGGAIESQQRQAGHQHAAQREALEATRRAVVREVQAQYQAVLAGAASVQNARTALAAAEQALAATRAGQVLGTRTMTDLLLAIQTRSSAQNALDQARHGHVLAMLLLRQASGALHEADLAAANQLLEPPTP